MPPIVGPVIAEYYLMRRCPKELKVAEDDRSVNVAALVAFVGGAVIAAINGKPWSPLAIELAPALLGLIASVVIYVPVRLLELRLGGASRA